MVFILIEYDNNLEWYKNVLLTFGNHARDSIQIVVGETKVEGYVILPCAIKLMEDEKRKVEVDKLDLGFCLVHVLYIILPCGFPKLSGVYEVGQEENKSNKMTIMGVEHVITFSNVFTYYEHIWLNPLLFLIITRMYIKDGMRDGRV
jgi:hypothetical protein